MMPPRELDLGSLTLSSGSRLKWDGTGCLMEAVAYFAGEPHSDTPQCVSPVLRNFGMSLNDQWDDAARQRLKPFIPLLVGTVDDGQDEARSYLALDWLIRTHVPLWLDLAGLTVEAAELRALPPTVDLTTSQAAAPALRVAGDRAYEVWSAAGDAARGAAREVAMSAARDSAWGTAQAVSQVAAKVAARDTARDTAWAAAWVAAGNIAWEEAWYSSTKAVASAVASAALEPTVQALQESALDLFYRMIDPSALAEGLPR